MVDPGAGVAGVAQAVAAVAVAGIQAAVAKSVADKQYDIAKRQLAIAVFVQDTWKNNHLPCELKLLSEVCAEPMYVPQYSLVTARAGNDVAIAFSKQRAEIRRKLSIYGVGSFQALERQMGVAEALVTTDAIAAARRREDGRADIKKQQRLDNQQRAVALGRGLLDQSASAMRGAEASYATGGATIASAVNSGAQLLGYLAGRDTSTGTIKRSGEYTLNSGDTKAGAVRAIDTAPITGFNGLDVTGKILNRAGVSAPDAPVPAYQPGSPADPNSYGDA